MIPLLFCFSFILLVILLFAHSNDTHILQGYSHNPACWEKKSLLVYMIMHYRFVVLHAFLHKNLRKQVANFLNIYVQSLPYVFELIFLLLRRENTWKGHFSVVKNVPLYFIRFLCLHASDSQGQRHYVFWLSICLYVRTLWRMFFQL